MINRRNAIKQLAALSAGALALPVRLRAESTAASVPGTAAGTALPAVTFHNIQETEPLADGGWRLNRVPAALWPKLNAKAQKRAYAPAGAELRFNVEGDARVFLRTVENRGEDARDLPVLGEIYYGDFYAGWFEVGRDWTEIVIRPPAHAALLQKASARSARRFAPELVRVALPYLPDVQLLAIKGKVSPARAEQMPARHYLAYGSSITNGAFATRPGDLYPARVAAALGVDHFNLGFGGGAHLEPEMADWIGSREDWDFATLEMGINLVGALTVEQFADRVAGFLPRIVKAHPEKWIFCIDMFTASGDFSDNPKYPAFRGIVTEAVRRIASPKVVHCDGRQLLRNASGLTLDFTHPSSDGFAEIAERLVAVMRPAVG